MIEKLKKRVQFVGGKMGFVEWFILKLDLIILGIIIGMYFSSFFEKYNAVLWIAFIVGFIYMAYVLFGDLYDNKQEEKGENNNVNKQ